MIELIYSMDPLVISTFMISAILLNVTPGSDVMFTLASSLNGGFKKGIYASLGISVGSLFHLTLATLGLSAVLQAEPKAYDIVRYLGAAYLIFLAVRTWSETAKTTPEDQNRENFKTFGRGFLTNILNPKVALFILAFIPQFVDPAIGPAWQQMLIFGIFFTISGLFITCLYAWCTDWLEKQINHTTGIFNKISALVYGSIAGKLVFE